MSDLATAGNRDLGTIGAEFHGGSGYPFGLNRPLEPWPRRRWRYEADSGLRQ